MKKRKGLIIAVGVIVLAVIPMFFLGGCGGGSDNTPANVAGVYKGTVTLSGYGRSITGATSANFNQDGAAVSGNIGAFAISGVVEGNNVTITGRSSSGYTIALNLTMDGETLSGSGTSSGGGYTYYTKITLNRISTKVSGGMSPAYDATTESAGVSGTPEDVLKAIIKDMQK